MLSDDDQQKLKESPVHSIANGDIQAAMQEERAKLDDVGDLDAIEMKPKIRKLCIDFIYYQWLGGGG